MFMTLVVGSRMPVLTFSSFKKKHSAFYPNEKTIDQHDPSLTNPFLSPFLNHVYLVLSLRCDFTAAKNLIRDSLTTAVTSMIHDTIHGTIVATISRPQDHIILISVMAGSRKKVVEPKKEVPVKAKKSVAKKKNSSTVTTTMGMDEGATAVSSSLGDNGKKVVAIEACKQ